MYKLLAQNDHNLHLQICLLAPVQNYHARELYEANLIITGKNE